MTCNVQIVLQCSETGDEVDCDRYRDINYPGNDLANYGGSQGNEGFSTYQSCADFCLATAECVFWTYEEDGTCRLKSDTDEPDFDDDFTCGAKYACGMLCIFDWYIYSSLLFDCHHKY